MAWTQADVDAIDDCIKRKISGGAIASYSIAGRVVQSMTIKELVELRNAASQEASAALRNCDFTLADTRER